MIFKRKKEYNFCAFYVFELDRRLNFQKFRRQDNQRTLALLFSSFNFAVCNVLLGL